MAMNDWLMTIAGACLTAVFFNVDVFFSFMVWVVTGEILHYVFGVKTAFLKMIGLTPSCD
jgi:hypothetical protein